MATGDECTEKVMATPQRFPQLQILEFMWVAQGIVSGPGHILINEQARWTSVKLFKFLGADLPQGESRQLRPGL